MTEPRNPDLEEAIFANPDDADAFRVLADWLEEQGHVRAQLIRLQMEARRKPDKPERTLFNKHHRELIGTLSKARHIEWLHGFARTVMLDGPNLAALDHPSSRFLAGLRFHGLTAELVEPLAARLPRTLKELAVYATPAFVLSLAPLWPVLAQRRYLETLDLSGSFDLSNVVLPSIPVLRLAWGHVDATSSIAKLVDRRPPLRELALDGCVDPIPVVALIERTALTRLVLRTTRTDEVLIALCKLPAAASIQVLELSRSDLGPDGLDALIAARSAFTSLVRLDVLGCTIEDDTYARLEALDIDVVGDRYDDADE